MLVFKPLIVLVVALNICSTDRLLGLLLPNIWWRKMPRGIRRRKTIEWICNDDDDMEDSGNDFDDKEDGDD